MLNWSVFIHACPLHDPLDTLATKAADNLIFHGSIETRAARVSLPSCPSPKLIINAPGFVVLGTYNVKPSLPNDIIMLFPPFCFVTPLGIATKDNIHTPPGHIGSDCYRPQTPGLSNYSCLFLVMLGI